MASVTNVRAKPLAPMRSPIRPPILDSYITRELAGPFMFALAGFFVFWFINIFFIAADYLINAHASPILVLRFLLFRIPQSVPYAFPFAMLFGTLLGISRLVADNEITALRTSGVQIARIARTPIVLGIALSFFTFWVNDTIVPAAVELSTRTFYQIVYNTATLPIIPQFFRADQSTGRVFYVGNVEPDHRTMDNVMIFAPATNSPFREVTNAEHAVIDGNSLVLEKARVVRFKPNGKLEEYLSAQDISVGLPLGETSDQFMQSGETVDAYMLSTSQLRTQIHSMKATGQGGSALQTLELTLGQKFSFPFATFIAVIVALPLSVIFGRKGRTLGFAMAIFVFFVYFLMISASNALGRNEAINAYVAAWVPNAIALTAGLILFRRIEH